MLTHSIWTLPQPAIRRTVESGFMHIDSTLRARSGCSISSAGKGTRTSMMLPSQSLPNMCGVLMCKGASPVRAAHLNIWFGTFVHVIAHSMREDSEVALHSRQTWQMLNQPGATTVSVPRSVGWSSLATIMNIISSSSVGRACMIAMTSERGNSAKTGDERNEET